MEQINTVELKDPSLYPDATVLKGILGDSYNGYEAMLELYEILGMECEWRYYKDGKAWLCKVQKKKKTIVWMSAWKGYMQATIYIHEKNIEALERLELSESSREKLLSARKVGKSLPCMFEIRTSEVLEDLKKVISLKLS